MKKYLVAPTDQYRRIRYWCGDESRLGLKTIPGRLITLKGVKPLGVTQWRRENFYLYGLVEPLTGEHFILEFSHLDTACFKMFLKQFAASYPEDLHILQLDNGAFHFSQSLRVPENLILLFQPPHTQATFWDERLGVEEFLPQLSREASPQKLAPQVNPIERLWLEIKRCLSWECFGSLNELREFVWQRLEKLNPSIVASITGWDFILEALFVSGFS